MALRNLSDKTEIIYSKDGSDAVSNSDNIAVVVVGEDPYTEWFGDKNLDLKDDITLINTLKDKGFKVAVLLISADL